jgi:hypothetical protein
LLLDPAALEPADAIVEPAIRPRVRGDCAWCAECQLERDGEVTVHRTCGHADPVQHSRPCVFASCRHHTAIEVTAAGSLKLVFPDLDLLELEHSCSLDEAGAGERTLDEVGARTNLTRERVRQVEIGALHQLRRRATP